MKLFFLFLLCSCFLFAQAQPVVGFSTFISTGLTKPVDIVNAGDGSNRLFFVQQNGIIRIYSGGVLLTTPFLDISSVITYDANGERGLLSIAFHPQYATNGYFFVYYNNSAGNVSLAQYHVSSGNSNVANPASGKVLMTTVKPFTNHNGCQLLFGPDGNLYFGTGDGGSGGDPYNNAQNPASRLGKMIRINVDNFTDNTDPYYDIPATNPFINNSNYLPEIYATGLRNPWRWSFDRQTHDMWIADVGQDAWEEVNDVPLNQTSGANYGWRCYEAMHNYDLSQCGSTPGSNKTVPIFEYAHNSAGGKSITGGYVYRGSEFPALQGYYICCDYVYTNGWLINKNPNNTYNVYQQTNFPANIVTFGEAEDGTMYAASLNGPVYKITVTAILPIKLLSFSGYHQDDKDLLNWTATVDASLSSFEVETSANGTRFTTVSSQTPQTNGTTASYQAIITGLLQDDVRYYRLKMMYKDGNIAYSAIIKIEGKPGRTITAGYNGAGQLQLFTPVQLQSAAIFNMGGQKIISYTRLQPGSHLLATGPLSPGIYLVQCITTNGGRQQVKMAVQ